MNKIELTEEQARQIYRAGYHYNIPMKDKYKEDCFIKKLKQQGYIKENGVSNEN